MTDILGYSLIFVVTFILSILAYQMIGRLDFVVKFRKKNLFYVGIIFIDIVVVCSVATLLTMLLGLDIAVVITEIIISAVLARPISSFYKIHRHPHFSIKKYFTKLPEKIETITAVIPNYNYANYLEERVASIVNQKYPISELIILDDCSSDNSIKVINQIVKELGQSHPNIKVRTILNSENSGNVFKQWAKAFKYATGDYVWICEADDLCSPYFLKQVMQGFLKNSKTVLAYSESAIVDQDGKRIRSDFREDIDYYKSGHWDRSYMIAGKKELARYTAVNCTIANVSSVVFKNNADIPFEKYLKTSQTFHLAGDWYFYARVFTHGDIFYNAESLNTYRSHAGSVSKETDNIVHYQEITRVQDDISKNVKVSDNAKILIRLRRELLRRNWFLGDDIFKYKDVSLEKLCAKHKITEEVLLSIIIPVHNVEKYLRDCLDSIFMDLPNRTEVIIIDDSSSDRSPEIIKEYQKKYPDIIIARRIKHGGAASARNEALEIARGRFIAFIDSDDFVSRYAYSTMLKKIIDEKSDFIHCDIAMRYSPTRVEIYEMENMRHKDQIARIFDVGLVASPCNKMYDKKLLDGIIFPKTSMNEDVAIIPQIILKAKKISYTNIPFYNYVQHSSSVQHRVFDSQRFVIFDNVKQCLEAILEQGIDKKNYNVVSGLLACHQLFALLIWVITKEQDKSTRLGYIKIFCEKYIDLKIPKNNIYIKKFLREYNLPKLIDTIYKQDVYKIDKYLKQYQK